MLGFKTNIQSVNNVNNATKISGLNFYLLNKTELLIGKLKAEVLEVNLFA